jgi:hypothetical protein
MGPSRERPARFGGVDMTGISFGKMATGGVAVRETGLDGLFG